MHRTSPNHPSSRSSFLLRLSPSRSLSTSGGARGGLARGGARTANGLPASSTSSSPHFSSAAGVGVARARLIRLSPSRSLSTSGGARGGLARGGARAANGLPTSSTSSSPRFSSAAGVELARARFVTAAQHGTARRSPLVPCLGRDLSTAALRGTTRQCRRAPPCRASPCPCRAVRLVWPTI